MNSPIINARRQLQWHRRLFCDAGTFALWGVWLWLFRPAALAVWGLLGLGLRLRHTSSGVWVGAGEFPLEAVVLGLVCTCFALVLWKHFSTQPALRPQLTVVPDYAGHFGLDVQTIAACRSSAVCVVHHDEHGRIVRVEASPVQPMAVQTPPV